MQTYPMHNHPASHHRRATRLAALLTALVLASCGSTPTPQPTASGAPTTAPTASGAATAAPGASPTASPTDAPTPAPTATPTPTAPTGSFPLAVVVHNTDLREITSSGALVSAAANGSLILPCGLATLKIGKSTAKVSTACTAASAIPAKLAKNPKSMALLPAALVDPRVKVLVVDGADLFGNTVVRTEKYPVVATATDGTTDLTTADVAYDANDVRTIVSTGDTCPDRSVSLWANVKGKGWDWTLQGGWARYTGSYMSSFGWKTMSAKRTGEGIGAVWNMIKDADLAVNDFECPMVSWFTQHAHGTYFTIDPKVATLLGNVGMDFASLGSNHGTDLGADGIKQTLDLLDKAGVKYSGMGMNLAEAMKPAVFDVRGMKIAFISWDATGSSRAATKTTAGELHPGATNVRKTIALAKAASDMVILMPQWNWPEYSAPFSATALRQRDLWFKSGVDHILGSGTHWASAISVTKPDPAKGYQLAITSHGNFLFGQMWSRQTQEGLIYEVTFRGKTLVQVRGHAYTVVDGGQPNLIEPTTDGAFVQNQVFKVSDLP